MASGIESRELLLPQLKDWNNGQGIDLLGWVGCSGNFDLAIGYTTLFWPDFVQHDGMVFARHALNERFFGTIKSCLEKFSNDKGQVERLINHLHLLDTHHVGCPGATPEKLEFLGKTLRDMWMAKLAQDFPGMKFDVELLGRASPDLSDFQITFHKVRD